MQSALFEVAEPQTERCPEVRCPVCGRCLPARRGRGRPAQYDTPECAQLAQDRARVVRSLDELLRRLRREEGGRFPPEVRRAVLRQVRGLEDDLGLTAQQRGLIARTR